MSFEDDLVDKIVALMRKRFGGVDEVALGRLFSTYDDNGDGQIDGAELARMLADAEVGNARTRKAWVRVAIQQLDKDGSRTISLSELATIIE